MSLEGRENTPLLLSKDVLHQRYRTSFQFAITVFTQILHPSCLVWAYKTDSDTL